MVRQPDATRQPTPQDDQLLSKHHVLSFKPQLRLEWRGHDGQNETEQPDHSPSLGDSVTSSTRIRFRYTQVLRAFRSRNGASHAIVRSILLGEQECAASPAVILEYEDVLKRPGILGSQPAIPADEIDKVLDAICARAIHVVPWFRFRPFLNDPKDDMYVECAMASGARIIVTDDRHFRHPCRPSV